MKSAIGVRRIVTLLWAIAAIPWLSAAASKLPAELVKFRAERAQMAASLAVPIAACVARYDTDHPAFHGCMDWHSATHGVWALVAYSWATGDDRYNDLVKSTIRPEALNAEREYLKEHPYFEMPYGRAWFLRLAIDYRKKFADHALDAMADDVAASLADYYSNVPPDPNSVAYSGSTWPLINLYEYAQSRSDEKLKAFVTRLVRRYYIPDTVCPALKKEVDTREFMALCTNWAWLVGDVLAQGEPAGSGQDFARWLGRFLPPDQLMEPIESPDSAHQSGLNFSRAWGLWSLYRITDDTAYLDAYLKHIRRTYSHSEQWGGRYETVAHWVPQFGMLALMVSYYDWP